MLYLVYPDKSESGTIETLPDTKGMKLFPESSFLENFKSLPDIDKICISSEATLESILACLADESTKRALQAMKDKHLFRELLKEDYPSLGYQYINYDDISYLRPNGKKVLKPVKGCFGTAVKVIDENSDLQDISVEILAEIKKNSAVFSDQVLSQSEFILEDYIDGEEYAVDMFYDSAGQPHIMNIYCHPLPRYKEYLHMIYYTNQSIFKQLYGEVMTFFNRLNHRLQVRNMALHSEFKYLNELVPIEINAMRFGGMGLGNMVYHSLNINPYEQFIKEESPNWNQIWANHSQSNFVYFIAYNGSNINVHNQRPNLFKLENQFTHILNRAVFDYQNQLAFAVYTLDETEDNIDRLLGINFNEYFEPIP